MKPPHICANFLTVTVRGSEGLEMTVTVYGVSGRAGGHVGGLVTGQDLGTDITITIPRSVGLAGTWAGW